VRGRHLSTWNFGSTGPRWSEIADFEPIFARTASAVTPSEKCSINTNRKSTTRFPMSLRWSSHVAPKPPKGAQNAKKNVFLVKSHFAWRKSATKFLCVKPVSDKVVRHSLAQLSARKWLVRANPSTWNFRSNWRRWSEMADTVWVKKVAPLKLFAIFSLAVNLCIWKLPWLLPKHIPMSTPILVHLSEYLYELYHFY